MMRNQTWVVSSVNPKFPMSQYMSSGVDIWLVFFYKCFVNVSEVFPQDKT